MAEVEKEQKSAAEILYSMENAYWNGDPSKDFRNRHRYPSPEDAKAKKVYEAAFLEVHQNLQVVFNTTNYDDRHWDFSEGAKHGCERLIAEASLAALILEAVECVHKAIGMSKADGWEDLPYDIRWAIDELCGSSIQLRGMGTEEYRQHCLEIKRQDAPF